MKTVRAFGAYALIPVLAVGCSFSSAFQPSSPSGVVADHTSSAGDLREMLERYATDRSVLRRFYDAPVSPNRRVRMGRVYTEWDARLDKVNFSALNQDGRIEYILFRNLLACQLRRNDTEQQKADEMAPLIPFADAIIDLHESRREMKPIAPSKSATLLTQLDKDLEKLRKAIEAGLESNKKDEADGDAKPDSRRAGNEEKIEPVTATKSVATRAVETIGALRKSLTAWFKHYDGYDPLFGWWVREPHKKFDKSLEDYAEFLREKVVGIKKDEKDPIVGDPLGPDALLSDLAREFIPYTPEELIAIGEKEYAWCEAEMIKASRELGFGDNWLDAVEHVKTLHVPPGDQPRLIRELALEAVDFLEERDLLTIPPLAKEIWRLEMMSPKRQKMTPFFTGGEVISVAFPTDTMTHEEKVMSLRGNNIHFARATVHHELIPGHHMQGFMTARHKPYRRIFNTPFWGEGWALYWELLLWDLDFARSAEDRVGMLFWRMHRCARIIFSLKFHLEQMTAEECVDFLVKRVGHEPENAKAEVRRSFGGKYSPLYQCAYMLGGLQFRALHQELVASGKMTNRRFHDAILHEGRIPVEMVRAKLTNEPLTPAFTTRWKFYGENP